EELQLQFLEAGFGGENLALQFLEPRRGEALRADQRLFALVIRRGAIEMRLGDLDVEAEHVVVADLQGGNPGPFTLAGLELRDHLAGSRGEAAQFIHLSVKPAPDDVSVAWILWGFLADGRIDFFRQTRIRRNARREVVN